MHVFSQCSIVQSDCLRNQFKGLVNGNKVYVIPNTVDNLFKELDRNNLSKTPQILFFGHLTKAKVTQISLRLTKSFEISPMYNSLFCGNMKRGLV